MMSSLVFVQFHNQYFCPGWFESYLILFSITVHYCTQPSHWLLHKHYERFINEHMVTTSQSFTYFLPANLTLWSDSRQRRDSLHSDIWPNQSSQLTR